MLSTVPALSQTVPTPRYRGPHWRPAHWRLALLAAAANALFAAAGCRLENEALQPRPRAGALSSIPTSEPLGAASLAASSEPGGFAPHDGAPRGPRHDLLSLSRTELWATWNSLRGDAYALDPIDRFIDTGGHIACDSTGLVNHRGQLVPYQGIVRVDPAFRERLVRFEQVVIDVATEVYGRSPARVRHLGAYVCRPTRNRSSRMSEHALGNAIDIAGFDFARAKKQQPLAVGLPSELRGPFQIRVARHWNPRGDKPVAAVHAHFLHELADRLSDRSDIFRGMIGPSRSDHSDHFHLDMSPWRYVYF
jgi:hypothetical protein